MSKSRIELHDTTLSMVMKMSGGNPGAVTVIARMLKESDEIDPDNILGGLGTVLALDTHSIYEEKIWMLYKDVCGESLVDTVGVLRAVQLGFASEREVQGWLNDPSGYAKAPDGRVRELMAQVRERLPAFAK